MLKKTVLQNTMLRKVVLHQAVLHKAVLHRVMLVSMASVILTACTTPQTQPTDGDDSGSTTPVFDAKKYSNQPDFCPRVTADKYQACINQSGSMQPQGMAGCYTCTIHYEDAGKICTDASDCQGGCYNYGEPVPLNVPNQKGQCAGNNVVFGCYQVIAKGMATDGMLCID